MNLENISKIVNNNRQIYKNLDFVNEKNKKNLLCKNYNSYIEILTLIKSL